MQRAAEAARKGRLDQQIGDEGVPANHLRTHLRRAANAKLLPQVAEAASTQTARPPQVNARYAGSSARVPILVCPGSRLQEAPAAKRIQIR